MKNRITYLFSLLISLSLSVKSQTDDYYNKGAIQFENRIYNDSIKTFKIQNSKWELSPPIIELNTDQKISFSFDELDANYKEYYFTLIHCDINWKPSQLSQNEYLSTFTEEKIETYAFSTTTVQKFIHYSASFPDENITPTKSGNYILKVYSKDNGERTIVTYRFLIYERKADLTLDVKLANNIESYGTAHDMRIKLNAKKIQMPDENLKIVVFQNFRWDNALILSKPKFINGDEYDYGEETNLFPAGNEYRYFDLKTLKYPGENVLKIDYVNHRNTVYLKTDERRTFKTYNTYKDIDGRSLIKTQDFPESTTDADYADVHFTLPYSAPIVHGTLYILGELTNNTFNKDSKMQYNYEKKQYEITLYLKQGYYNYLYALVENGTTKGDVTFIENSFKETENEYCAMAYYKAPGEIYYSIIAMSSVNSNN